MEKRDLELIESLVGKDDELRVLMLEHRELEKTLDTIQQKPYLNASEEVEKKNIQKVKLAGRDRIEEILSSHR